MQKTYDECYLICSTAVYFESQVCVTSIIHLPNTCLANATSSCNQNNEAEALRSWRSALDQIYYHNAYRVPPNYRPKSETEKALQDSLRDMELQCKERVDLLEALRQSRRDSKEGSERSSQNTISGWRPRLSTKNMDSSRPQALRRNCFEESTNSAVIDPNLPKSVAPHPPDLPPRPAAPEHKDADASAERSSISPSISSLPKSGFPYSPPTLPVPPKQASRTPSPDKKSRMLTTLRGYKDGKRTSKSPRVLGPRSVRPPAASKAAGLAWDSTSRGAGLKLGQTLTGQDGSTLTVDSVQPENSSDGSSSRKDSLTPLDESTATRPQRSVRPRTPDLVPLRNTQPAISESDGRIDSYPSRLGNRLNQNAEDLNSLGPPSTSHYQRISKDPSQGSRSPSRQKMAPEMPSYRNEYPAPDPSSKMVAQYTARVSESGAALGLPIRQRSPQRKTRPPPPSKKGRSPVADPASPRAGPRDLLGRGRLESSGSSDERAKGISRTNKSSPPRVRKANATKKPITLQAQNDSSEDSPDNEWNALVKHHLKNLPKGVDESAAKQIFNEVVVSGDEVHWDDIAGLDVAKKALKEAVVYPFLRPDLFMGLREPARGMLLFGPPGTGKTMLARAVATESRSTFFAISASSLTSKWLGESEKLVRALFSLAKALAPSIIFVDEIDSLLSSRGGSSEHESTRRIKTEFLIQWSDLQRAAAGKVSSDKDKQEGDATRVLVLAATNMPWAVDEAARRRFVRRQYIPLPEKSVRESQLRTLLSHQKHSLSEEDIQVLVELTDEGCSPGINEDVLNRHHLHQPPLSECRDLGLNRHVRRWPSRVM
ncbi:MAG: hypothetical protein LQ342_007623 [Letrouitia transgressa]|nr:MAG: hypothetical protein LQ342_007623 [Letrouitia transgressa]